MATVKSSGKPKANKTVHVKTTKKPHTTKTPKIIASQPVPVEQKLVPISPEFEEKLTKSYYSLEKYLRGTTYGTPIFTFYLLYLIIKSKGELLMILAFLGFVVVNVGLAYCSHLFTKQSKKSIVIYTATLVFSALFIVFISWFINSDRLIQGSIIGYFIMILIGMEMLRLKKYNFLY